MKKKYYLSYASGRFKIFSSFNQMLRELRLNEDEAMKLAEILGKPAFTGNNEIVYKDEEKGITIEYR